MRRLATILVIMLSMAASATAQSPHDWKFSRSEVACRMEALMSDGQADRHIAIDLPAPGPHAMISLDADPAAPANGTATIEIGSGTPLSAPFSTSRDADGRSVVKVRLTRGQFEAVVAAPAVTLRGIGASLLTFAPLADQLTQTTMHACQDGLLNSLALDPSDATAAKTPAVGSNSFWLTNADFPRGGGGVVAIVWKVGADRKIADCRVVLQSGNPLLGRAVCRALESRARYEQPALDARGEPVASFETRIVRAVD